MRSPGHDGGAICRHIAETNARYGKTRARAFHYRYRARICRGGAASARDCSGAGWREKQSLRLKMREIVVDTETTGLEPDHGHRIVEIGCVELLNTIPTGEIFHSYIDPERDMPESAFRVHGLSAAFLAGKQAFAQVASVFLTLLDDATL